jgi:hypothetical protein
MKSYTDLEQSKKLAEILPIESADMWYSYYGNSKHNPTIAYNGEQWFLCQKRNSSHSDIPCWSLTALLSILPYKIKLSHDTIDASGNPAYKNECYKFYINRCGLFGDKWNVQYCGKHERQLGKRYKQLYIDLFLSENYDNPIDACYDMVLKLNEQKLL